MTGPGTNTYLVRGAAGRGCGSIDRGPAGEPHLARVAERAAAAGGARAILITHGHPDHVEGAPRLRALTGAPVLAWSRDGSPEADETLADGATLSVGGRVVEALHTPGHRFDHLCFLLPESGTLFAGDLVAGSGPVVIRPPEGDPLGYLASLRRVIALDLRGILPAHGPAIERPRQLLEDYLRHRDERERQVLAGAAAREEKGAGLGAASSTGGGPQPA